MKVAWIHDHLLEDIPDGGAQITNNRLISIGREKGHDIGIFTPKNTTDLINEYDIAIAHNIKFFNHSQLLLMARHPFLIKHEHDYWNMLDETHEKLRAMIWNNSKLGIFLSPAHHNNYKGMMPWLNVGPIYLFPSPVDVDAFIDYGHHDSNIVLAVSAMVDHKGTEDVIEYARKNPDYEFHFYGTPVAGYLDKLKELKNCHYKGVVKFSDMPEIYNMAYSLIHLPRWVEPCGRSVIEARLCGCKLYLNERVGIASYPWWNESDEIFRECIRLAPFKYWDKVESLWNGLTS